MAHFFKKTVQVSRAINKLESQRLAIMGRGGGQMVSMLAFYSDDSSLNPAVKFVFEKNKNRQKEAGVGPFFLKKISNQRIWYIRSAVEIYNCSIHRHLY